ncbi:MAG TPA: hypothetical protein VF844_03240 [Ktedonobacteraceae bacterium]
MPAGRGAGGTPGLTGAGVGCSVGAGAGVGEGAGVDVEQEDGEGEGIGVVIAPGWPGTWLVPQAAIAINRTPKSNSAPHRRIIAYIVSSSFAHAL